MIEILQILQNFTPLGIAGLALFILYTYIVMKRNNMKLYNNDLYHIGEDIKSLRGEIDKMYSIISKHAERISYIEAVVEKKHR